MKLRIFFPSIPFLFAYLFLNSFSMAMEENTKEQEKNLIIKSDNKYTETEDISTESNKTFNQTALSLEEYIREAISKIENASQIIKVEKFDPNFTKNILLKSPNLKPNEPNLLFLISAKSLRLEREERPQEVEKESKKRTKGELLQKQLDRILKNADPKLEENTALLSYRHLSSIQSDGRGLSAWDDSAKFLEELDKAFFNPPSSSKAAITSKITGGIIGLGATLPLEGLVVESLERFFNFPSDKAVSQTLAYWILGTLAPVSTRILFIRAGKIFAKDEFLTLGKDEKLTQIATNNVKKRLTGQLLNTKSPGEDLTTAERKNISTQAQEEVGEDYRSKPHIFKKSDKHKSALLILAFSSAVNGLIPALVIFDAYADYSHIVHFPWDYILAPPVIVYYALNYFDFGTENLWNLFSHYSYIGHSGQTSEEDSREKRRILTERIKQFQSVIAESKYDVYVKAIYDAINSQKNKLKLNNLTDEDEISAFSLLMLKDKIRIDEESSGKFARAANFKKDLDVIKVSWKDDFIDKVTAGIVGAGFYADTEIIRYTLEQILKNQFGLDPITSAELSCFYATAFLDVSFRGIIEFNLHQNNLKGWLKAFSLKHLVDFQWLRKGLGGVSTVNGLLHSFPKFYVGWLAFQNYPLLGRLAMLVPSSANNFSLNQAIFDKNYNGIVTDCATFRPTENMSIHRQRALLKYWSDKAVVLINTRFDDETIDKMYAGIHRGM